MSALFELTTRDDGGGVDVVCNGALVGTVTVDPPECTSAFTFHAEHHTAVTWADRRSIADATPGIRVK